MQNGTMAVFGCEIDERAMFERRAADFNVGVLCVTEPLGRANAGLIPPGGAVSVNHKAPVDARLIHTLRDRGVSYLSSRSAGLDHIDGAEAKLAGILVRGVSYSPGSVAEYTIMLMLMAIRGACSILRRAGRQDFRLEDSRARELSEMTVGVVGAGRIGGAVIDRLKGFGCPIIAYDPHPRADAEYAELDELLRRSDIVTLHLPLTASTRRIIDRARVKRMKRGAILINTARGALIDASALADSLERGWLASAALDVVEGEEGWFYNDCASAGPPPFARLLALPNVVITPHTAFYTRRALDDVVFNTLADYLKYKGGNPS